MKVYPKKITYYVDPENGNDAGRGSKTSPFRSLAVAAETIKGKMQRSEEEGAYRIVLLPGVHRLEQPIVFDGDNIKALDYTLTFSGTNGAVITSAVPIDGKEFVKVDERPYYRYTLKEEEGTPDFRDFYCNGKLVSLATSGYERVMTRSIPNDKDRAAKENEVPKLYILQEAVEGIDEDSPIPLELWIKVEWQLHAVRIVKIDKNDTVVDDKGQTLIAVTVHEDDWPSFVRGFYSTLRGRYYWGKNQLAYLTQENSFFYDKKNRTIYFYPPKGVNMETASLAYPTLQNLLVFRNIRNVTVEDIAFTGTTSNYITENGYIAGQGGRIKKQGVGFLTHAAVYGHNTYNLSVERCRFYMLGTDGVNTTGCTDSASVERSTFEYIAMSPIRIGRCSGKLNTFTNLNANIRIVNNYIRHPGCVYKSNVGILVGPVRNLKICYNTLLDTPYSAISVGWNWSKATFEKGSTVNIQNAEIAYNRVENFMFGMKDGGAIYTLGGNSPLDDHELFNSVHDNYCVVGPTTGQKTGGYTVLYHDGSSSNWLTAHNVIETRPDNPSRFSYISYQSITAQQVYNITARDNYFLNLDDENLVLGNGHTKEKQRDLFLYKKNNHVGVTLETLDRRARSVMEGAGADGYRKILK